jgi:Transposase DDE domain
MNTCETISHQQVHQLLDEVLGPGLHAKRIASLADATLGVMHTASLAVCTIGHGLAMARGLNARHAVKQVDRMLSNPGIDVDQILALWVPFVIGARTSLLVAMDWTDFDADNQATIMLSLITEHGRATPLVWLTVNKAELKDRRSLYERRVLVRLAEIVPAGVGVCIVADRGFGDQNLYRLLTEELHFEYVIRFRGNIKVTAASGVTRTAAAWVSPSGRARVLREAMVTADRYPVGTVVCVRDPEMKQAWCLAASSTEATAKDLTGYYGSRWGIESSLRDSKDLRFGMGDTGKGSAGASRWKARGGMGSVHVSTPERRDRLWLINGLAVVLLTLLGAASEAVGYDRMLKTNTSKRREHSLFRQGCMVYDLIPTMPESWLQPLMLAFTRLLDQQPLFSRTLGFV